MTRSIDALLSDPLSTDQDMSWVFSDDGEPSFLSAWPLAPNKEASDRLLTAGGGLVSTGMVGRFTVTDKKKADTLDSSSSSGGSTSGKKKPSAPSTSGSSGTTGKKKPAGDSSGTYTGVKKTDTSNSGKLSGYTTPKKPLIKPSPGDDSPFSTAASKSAAKKKPSSSGSSSGTGTRPPQIEYSSGSSGFSGIPPDIATVGSSMEDADDNSGNTPWDGYFGRTFSDLTSFSTGAIADPVSAEDSSGFFSRVGSVVKDFFSGLFPGTGEEASGSVSMLPVALPPTRSPSSDTDPVGSFRAGYISQRDLESALGRESWTMCCAASFVYAVQTKYPGLGRDDLLGAAEAAANTALSDGSGTCVSDDGYIRSIYQYSQALSKNLGLDEYVDTSGNYSSVEDAQNAGVEMMKVELSGISSNVAQEHHVVQIGNRVIDPAPGQGIEELWDKDSSSIENVMALDWYPLP